MRVFSILKSKLYKVYTILKDLFFIVIGCFLAAIGTGSFLLPNQLSSGGFAGIATIIYYFYEINLNKYLYAQVLYQKAPQFYLCLLYHVF